MMGWKYLLSHIIYKPEVVGYTMVTKPDTDTRFVSSQNIIGPTQEIGADIHRVFL